MKAQSAYGRGVYDDRSRCNSSLLRISDKILAGFLYSKLIGAPEYAQIDIQVLSQELAIVLRGKSPLKKVRNLTHRKILHLIFNRKNQLIVFRIQNHLHPAMLRRCRLRMQF